jgi:hypothetical protein
MDTQDRRAIEELFGKLEAVEHRTGPRDPEAEAFIRSRVAAQPGAPYYMAQTIIVQEQALEQAKRRIDELEGAGREPEGGLLSGLFGGRNRAADRRPVRREAVAPQPWGNQRGGGFLSGAAQTAVGVAGGLLLGNLLMGTMFGNDAAASQAADTNTDSNADNADADQEFDNASADSDLDGGGDFGGDFGGGDF